MFWLLAAPDGHAKNFSVQLARSTGVEGLWERMVESVERAPSAIGSTEEKLPKGFPETVYAAIANGIARHSKVFQTGIKHLSK